jgi:hypothetical protein
MPRQVAAISLVAGLAVVAFGVALLFIQPPDATVEDRSQSPLATLEPVGTSAPLDSTSDVTGTIVSPSKKAMGGVAVELVPLFEGRGAKVRKTTSSDDGAFAFTNVKLDLGSPYVVEAVYDGARFPSTQLRAPRGSDPSVEIAVAKTTRKVADLSVSLESLTVVGDDEGLQAVHALTLRNVGDRAYVGKVAFPLLRGAASIQEGTGLDRRLLDLSHGLMTSSKPVLPGRTDVSYTYVTQMSKSGIPFTRQLNLDTERYELLVTGDLAVDEAKGIRADGDVTLGAPGAERSYERWDATGLKTGDNLGARFVVDTGPDLLRVGAPIAAGVVALLLLAFGLLRRRRKPPVADEAITAPSPTSA